MITTRTCFVIGAGASAELNLPTGEKLKEQIAGHVNFRYSMGDVSGGDSEVLWALKNAGVFHMHQVSLDGAEMARSLPDVDSIDRYLEIRSDSPGIVAIGKLGIAQAILQAEAACSLMPNFSSKDKDLTPTSSYLPALMRQLTAGTSAARVEDVLKRVTFIIFNYDRCVEEYLFRALKNVYGQTSERVAEVLRQVKFYHPYGVVGQLPWQDPTGQPIPLGMNASSTDLARISPLIRTYCERVEGDDPVTEEMRAAYANCQHLVFLGFGYIDQNLELLAPREDKMRPVSVRRVMGTCMGMSDRSAEVVRGRVRRTLREAQGSAVVELVPTTCRGLFHEFDQYFSR